MIHRSNQEGPKEVLKSKVEIEKREKVSVERQREDVD